MVGVECIICVTLVVCRCSGYSGNGHGNENEDWRGGDGKWELECLFYIKQKVSFVLCKTRQKLLKSGVRILLWKKPIQSIVLHETKICVLKKRR